LKHPAVVERIEERRRFMRDKLRITVKDSILPPVIDALAPTAWLARGDCWRGDDSGGQQGRAEAGGLTRRLIQFREIRVNSAD
jgi:hypothetical protein